MADVMLGYLSLSAAIVEQAAKDFRSFPNDVRHFFCDSNGMFDIYMPRSDGTAVYNKIAENYEKYNSWKTPESERIRKDILEDDGIDIFEEDEEDMEEMCEREMKLAMSM